MLYTVVWDDEREVARERAGADVPRIDRLPGLGLGAGICPAVHLGPRADREWEGVGSEDRFTLVGKIYHSYWLFISSLIN